MTPWAERSLDDLIAALRAFGYETPLDLAEEFVRRGPAAVDALCAVLRDPATWAPTRESEHMLPVHALLLLGAIADPRGAPAALEVARAHELGEYTWEDVPFVLASFGPATLPDLMALAADRDAAHFARWPAMRAMYLLACDHAALRPQVEAFLIETLATPDLDPDLVRDVGGVLHDVGSASAREALGQAVAKHALDPEIAALGEAPEASSHEGWQRDTRVHDWRHHFGPGGTLENVRERLRSALQRRALVATSPRVGPASPARATPKPGRNDACPCGSGKKYKKCCGR